MGIKSPHLLLNKEKPQNTSVPRTWFESLSFLHISTFAQPETSEKMKPFGLPKEQITVLSMSDGQLAFVFGSVLIFIPFSFFCFLVSDWTFPPFLSHFPWPVFLFWYTVSSQEKGSCKDAEYGNIFITVPTYTEDFDLAVKPCSWHKFGR